MRSRNRRPMIRMATDPRFAGIHQHKIAAVAEPFSFPTQTTLRLVWGPRLWVAMVLLHVATLLETGCLLRG